MSDVKGILGEKLGMTQIFDDTRAIPVTVIKAGPCRVAQVKTPESDGYSAVQLVFGTAKKPSKPAKGHFEANGTEAGTSVVELRTDDAGSYTPGQEIGVDIFQPGDRTDVVGVSKGKGFAGVMKRHGFSGLGASHGAEKVHRSPGSVGACATPSRVFKGTRMAGHMGNRRVTALNVEIADADPGRNIVLVKGTVPGAEDAIVLIRKSVKKK